MQSYDYQHRQGVEAISWKRFAELYTTLAEALDQEQVEAVVGIAKAGMFPATAVACSLRCEIYPVRLTRRVNDVVTYQHPVWKVGVSPRVAGKTVAPWCLRAVIDEIADTGETLALVADQVRAGGASRVVTAALVSHTWADPFPQVVALVTDALVLFPWDQRVYQDGRWQLHPELVEALKYQEKGSPESQEQASGRKGDR